jgi:hypothetical protein
MPGVGGQLGGGGQGVGGGTGLQTFDTGQRRPQRTLVRQHVLAALEPLLKSNGGYIHRIKPYPRPLRNLSGEDLDLLVSELQSQVPAIVVALGKKTYLHAGLQATEVIGELEVEVYALNAHQRAMVEGRLEQDAIATTSKTNDPGIETMLEHIEERLLGQDVGVATSVELRGKSEDEVATNQTHTLWCQVYTVHLERDVNPDRDAPGPITEVEVNGFPDGDVKSTPLTTTLTELEVPAP